MFEKRPFVAFVGLFFNFWPLLLWGAIFFSKKIKLDKFYCPKSANKRGSSFVWIPKIMEPSPWIWLALNA
jgi:hypothetical protein